MCNNKLFKSLKATDLKTNNVNELKTCIESAAKTMLLAENAISLPYTHG